MSHPELDALRARLAAAGDPARAVRERAYLKSDLTFLGTGMPEVTAAARELAKVRPMDHARLVELVDAMWAEPVHELRAVAVVLLEKHHKHLVAADLPWLEAILRGARTWAYVDAIAVHAVGPLCARHPELGAALDRWSTDPDFWIRRSAMLALLLDLRKGRGDAARFFRYADAMLDEKEFFVRKAIGWILREYGKKQPDAVADWLAPRTGRVAGLTLREAVKYLPAPRRDALLAAYRAR